MEEYLTNNWGELGFVISVSIALFMHLSKKYASFILKRELVSYKSDLDRERDTFKNELHRETSLKLEEYKGSLEVERTKLQIRYGGIFEKQAFACLELYKKVVIYERAVKPAAFSNDANEETIQFDTPEYEYLKKELINLKEYFEENKILFPERLTSELNKFIDVSFLSVFHIRSVDWSIDNENMKRVDVEQNLDIRRKAEESLSTLEPIKKKLEKILSDTIGTIEE